MIRLIAIVGFALAIASPTQAMPRAAIQSEGMITPVAFGCGPRRTMVNGVCVATIRHHRRCVRCTLALRTIIIENAPRAPGGVAIRKRVSL